MNTFRLANVHERELDGRSPDARERRLNVSQTFPDARLADVRERSLSLIYLLTNVIGPTYSFYRPTYAVPFGFNVSEISLYYNIFACVV